MSHPVILVTTHRVQGDPEALRELGAAFVASIEANEPDAIDLQLYLAEDRSELTHLLIERDAEAMDHHFRVSGDLIGRALEAAETTSIRVLGEPGPVLRQVLDRNSEAGVPVFVQPRPIGGLARRTVAV